MRVFDKGQNKEIEVPTKIYVFKTKPGTKGTIEDPHRPLLADRLKNKPHHWTVDENAETIAVSAKSVDQAKIALDHNEVANG